MTNYQSPLNADDLTNLLDHVSKTIYKPKDMDPASEVIMARCLDLIRKDYQISVISNAQGELCSQYPSQIPIMEYTLTDPGNLNNERVQSLYDINQLRDLITKARFARCRARFVVPVILYEGKFICRSGTISGGVEIYGRSGFDLFFTGGESIPGEESDAEAGTTEWQLFNRLRGQDIRLLKELSVKYIVDLMMEKKKVKFGMNVTSSEKVDKQNRYGEFTICSLPYPGCEFFKEWKDNSYNGEGLVFDWTQAYVDAHLDVPQDRIAAPITSDFKDYKAWDLVKITSNYLKLLLEYIKEGEKGVLVHCISGWDRTPLFVSLLRLSLWADGAAHASLSAIEILYLTIAYDWYLFGHNFPDRMLKGEEIFFFCFTFLKYIVSEDFSVHKRRPRSISTTDSDSNLGVLLETDHVHCNETGQHSNGVRHRGSNSSLNSNGSGGSQLNDSFTMCPRDNDSIGGSTSSSSRKSPSSRLSSSSDSSSRHVTAGVHVTSHLTGSSPMAVPVRHLQEQARSPCSSSVGSWQIISGTGSLRGTTSSCDSSDHRSSLSSAHSCCLYHETAILDDDTSARRQKLETARRIFHSMYSASIGFSPPSENGGISGLLDHFAEKVGFRSRAGMP